MEKKKNQDSQKIQQFKAKIDNKIQIHKEFNNTLEKWTRELGIHRKFNNLVEKWTKKTRNPQDIQQYT